MKFQALAATALLLAAAAGAEPSLVTPPDHPTPLFGISSELPFEVLPAPSRDAMPLGDALSARATHREFSSAPLTLQELSDLLWAANGYNRPGEKKRTAPTAINRQEIDIYVLLAEGACIWEPGSNELRKVCDDDLRGFTGRMDAGPDNFAVKAPVTLVYVIDYARQGMQARPADAFKYASVDCGFVGQNVYLHCAAAGLNTVFLGMIDAERIAQALQLPPTRVPLFAQTVGKVPEP